MGPVWLVGPDRTRPGGVNQALEVLQNGIPEIRRLEVGRSDAAPWAICRGWRAVWARRGHGILHLNPSVRHAALTRDMVLLAGWKGPAVAWFHGWSDVMWQRLQRGPGRALLMRFCARARPVALCEFHRERLASAGVPLEAIAVVPPAYRSSVVGSTGGRDDGPVVFIGRLVRAKGVDRLLDARRMHPDGFGGRPLVFLGSGPEESALRERIRQDGLQDVHVEGWVSGPTLKTWLERASMVVLPTLDDAVPLSLVEALASGLPVVASPVGGIPELVGDAGLLVDPEPQAIAQAISTARSRIAPATRASAAERMVREFSEESVRRRWRAVYAADPGLGH